MIRIALAGYGTVGQGVMDLFHKRKEAIEQRLGKQVDLPYVLVRDASKPRDIDLQGAILTSDVRKILDDETVQIVMEATGDIDLGYRLMKEALEKKKHVITANKSVLSLHFEELSEKAREHGVYLLYEASVGGGTPLIKPLQDLSLHGEIRSLRGLLSGSCNYVLTKLREESISYEEVVEEATELGFLEADPIDDVGGFDTRRKLRILATLAFQGKTEEADISLEGITELKQEDISRLGERGYAVRLLAQAKREGQRVQASVHPVALPKASFLGAMDGAENGVEFFGENFIKVSFQGSGAGRYPTAHAMLSDLEDALFELRRKDLVAKKEPLHHEPFNEETRFYIRSAEPLTLPVEEKWGENIWLTAPIEYLQVKSMLPPEAVAIPIEK